LQIEVTESYVMEKPASALAAIENLKALGAAVALDDFGTGYSSIGYLRSFRFDTLKIDKSLAGLVDVDAQAANWSRDRTYRQRAGHDGGGRRRRESAAAALLRRAGCDRLQGFYFSEPMPISSLLLLRQQQG
jgi:EAL domain-containing protein (putative c-di-GMP-specific phosphodiesterase class I)